QAFFNVLAGERFKYINNELKLYQQGRYGKAPGEVNEQQRRQAIGSEEVNDVRPADLIKPELNNLRTHIGNQAKTE
ncbi:pyruvate carboxylase subunit B, partial [Pseudomonas aeruginosa]